MQSQSNPNSKRFESSIFSFLKDKVFFLDYVSIIFLPFKTFLFILSFKTILSAFLIVFEEIVDFLVEKIIYPIIIYNGIEGNNEIISWSYTLPPIYKLSEAKILMRKEKLKRIQ